MFACESRESYVCVCVCPHVFVRVSSLFVLCVGVGVWIYVYMCVSFRMFFMCVSCVFVCVG